MTTEHLMCPPPIAASVPASLISSPPAPSPRAARVGREYVDDLSGLYAMATDGDCMEPLVYSGDKLVFSTTAALKVGNLAVIWRSPAATPAGEYQAIVKRLVTLPPAFAKLPYLAYPEQNVWPFAIAEFLNPPTRLLIYCSDVLAIHACVGRLDRPGRVVALGATGDAAVC